MPKKKKIVAEVSSVAVIEPEIKEKPRKHIVQIKTRLPVRGFPGSTVEVPVGEIIYWESTNNITYDYEIGHQIYMDNFVGRAIQVPPKTWIPREHTRKWAENLPKAILDGEYFTSEVLSMYETE